MLSRYRPGVPIYALVPNSKEADMMMLDYAVEPLSHFEPYSKDLISYAGIQSIVEYLKKEKRVTGGQLMIVIHGDEWMKKGKTSSIKIIEV
jgi:pyruvate kinase